MQNFSRDARSLMEQRKESKARASGTKRLQAWERHCQKQAHRLERRFARQAAMVEYWDEVGPDTFGEGWSDA